MSGFLPPQAHIRDEPVVILRQRTAQWLIEAAGIGQVISARGRSADRDVWAELQALAYLGSSAAGSARGTSVVEQDPASEDLVLSPRGQGMTTAAVAVLAETTTRAVTKAIGDGRLPAQHVGRDYVIAEADAHEYAQRAAQRRRAA